MYGMVGHEQSAVPAQPAKKSANKRGKKALKWRTGDIDAVKTDFHEEFWPAPVKSVSIRVFETVL